MGFNRTNLKNDALKIVPTFVGVLSKNDNLSKRRFSSYSQRFSC